MNVSESDADIGRVTVHRLVDGVVDDLPHQMVQAGAAHAADVHAGPLANRLEPFEYSDVLGRILLLRHALLAALRVVARVLTPGPSCRLLLSALGHCHSVLAQSRRAAVETVSALCVAASAARFRRAPLKNALARFSRSRG